MVSLVTFFFFAQLATASKQPHLVFILVDDLGFNDFYTSSDLSAAWPNVAKMSQECVKVEQYYTQPICTPTRAAFMSGRMPIRLGLQHDVITGYQDYGLPLDEATLADKLVAVGYNTIGVGKWHLGMYNNASTPTRRGFNHFYGYFNGAEDYLTHEIGGYLDLHDDERIDYDQKNVYSAKLLAAQALRRIEEHKAAMSTSPLFLYFPLQNVHAPLEALDEYKHSAACKDVPNKDRKTFCGMARAADDAIGNVTAALESAFPGDDIVLVISGDNGGMPFEAGNNCPDWNKLCLRGHKAELFEGGVRNNAILCSKNLLPSDIKGSTYSKGLVHVMDWHATFRDLGGARDKSGKPTDGVNVWDAITKNQASPRKEFLLNIDPCSGHGACKGEEAAYRFQGCVGEDCGDWKLLTGVAPDSWYKVPTSSTQNLSEPSLLLEDEPSENGGYIDKLFNISADPSEAYNIASTYPAVVTELKKKIKALAAEAVAPCNIPSGSCYDDDKSAQAILDTHKAWFPWAADPSELLEVNVIV